MKFKTTIILFVTFFVLLGLLLIFESREKKKLSEKDKLVDVQLEDIQEVLLKEGENIIRFIRKSDDEWMIKEPLEAEADNYEVNRLAEDFGQLKMERIVEEQPEDLSKYGIPQKEVILKLKETETPIEILIGNENPLDKTLFAKRSDQERIVLLPSHLSNLLEKEVFDFRKKDIFSFETEDVKEILLESRDFKWEAQKKDDEWFLIKPVESLADKDSLSGLLYSLSNLKAEEFVSEDKNENELKNFGLNKPQFKITLKMPEKTETISFLLNKKNETLFVTASNSPKIVSTEDTIVKELEKPPHDLREKKVLDFYTWETEKLKLKTDQLEFTLSKDEDNNWLFEPSGKPAEKEKIESFLRKVSDLKAEEFIDPPINLKDYGLDPPQVELWLRTGDEEEQKEFKLLIGESDPEKKTVVVKNDRLDYLFQVKNDILKELPGSIDDWKKDEPEDKEKEENR